MGRGVEATSGNNEEENFGKSGARHIWSLPLTLEHHVILSLIF